MKSAVRVIFICCAGLVLLLPGLYAAGKAKSVLDYYRLLMPEMLDGTRFEFTKKGTAWKTTSPITEAELDCTVDLKNGYMEVSDPGTGGGTLTQEMALFINKMRESFMGVNITTFDGIGVSNRCRFYRWTGGGWAVARVLPDIPLVQFFKPGFDFSSVKGSVSLLYALPRKGTTVIAKLDVSRLRMMMSDNMGFGPEDQKKAKQAMEHVAFNSVELNWDMDRSVFIVGKMLE